MINHNANITIQERTENFAIRVIKAYCELTKRPFDELWQSLIKAIFEKWNEMLSNEYRVMSNEFSEKTYYSLLITYYSKK